MVKPLDFFNGVISIGIDGTNCMSFNLCLSLLKELGNGFSDRLTFLEEAAMIWGLEWSSPDSIVSSASSRAISSSSSSS